MVPVAGARARSCGISVGSSGRVVAHDARREPSGSFPRRVHGRATAADACPADRATGSMGATAADPRDRRPTTSWTRSTPSSARWPPRLTRPDVRARGRRHGQDPGHHAPHRLRRARRRLHAAAGAGGDLHRAGGGRDAHPAARPRASAGCRRAPSTPPRCASCTTSGRRRSAAPRPRCCRTRPRLVAEAASRLRLQLDRTHGAATSPPRSSGPRSACSPRRPTPRRRAAAGRDPAGLDATAMARLLAGLRGGQGRARRHRLRGRAAGHRRACCSRAAGHRRAGPQPVPPLRRRRVPGRQPAAAAAARPVARRARRRSASSATPAQTIYSFTGATPAPPARVRRAATRGPQVVKLVRDYRSTPQVVGLANLVVRAPGRHAGSARRAAGAAAGRPRRRRWSPYPDDAGRGRRRRARPIAELVAPGIPPSEIAVLFRTNAQSEALRVGPGRRGHPLPACAAASGSSPARRCARRSCCCAAPPGGRRRRQPLRRARARRPGRRRLEPSGRRAGGGAVRERWESLQALAALADDAGHGRRPERQAARAGAPSWTSAPPPSTRPPCRASRWRRCTPPRAWSGTRSSWSGCSDGLHARSRWPTAPRRSRRSAACCTSGITRAREHLRLSWAGLRARPAAAASRRPSRFLDGCGQRARRRSRSQPRAAGRRAAGEARQARRRRRGAAPAAPTLVTAAERKIGRCDDCPPTYDEAHVRGAARLASGRGHARRSVPAYVVFTDATLTAIAERDAVRRRRARHDLGRRGRASSHVTASRCWRSWRWSRPGRGRPKRFCCRQIRGAGRALTRQAVKVLR